MSQYSEQCRKCGKWIVGWRKDIIKLGMEKHECKPPRDGGDPTGYTTFQ